MLSLCQSAPVGSRSKPESATSAYAPLTLVVRVGCLSGLRPTCPSLPPGGPEVPETRWVAVAGRTTQLPFPFFKPGFSDRIFPSVPSAPNELFCCSSRGACRGGCVGRGVDPSLRPSCSALPCYSPTASPMCQMMPASPHVPPPCPPHVDAIEPLTTVRICTWSGIVFNFHLPVSSLHD